MPIQGFVRYRKHQFGRQAAFGTKVAATRAYPLRGTPTVNLNWTDPDIDVGSVDPVAAPYRTAPDLSSSLSTPALAYNDVPLLMSGFFGGSAVPTGSTALTWSYDPASTIPDAIDVFTYEFGDDVTDDWFQFGDGALESFEISGPEGLGPITASGSWRFGSVASSGSTDSPDSPTVPTADLEVSTTDAVVYLKDMKVYIASDYASLATSQITDALHSFTLRATQELDQKRFANGDQTFDVDAYGRGARTIELECVFAKTADTVGTGSESDAWMSDDVVNRYARLEFTSTVDADTGVPYSWTIDLPLRYMTRAEGEIGGNTTITLMGRAFYDPDGLGGVFTSTVVNTLSSVDLGDVAS